MTGGRLGGATVTTVSAGVLFYPENLRSAATRPFSAHNGSSVVGPFGIPSCPVRDSGRRNSTEQHPAHKRLRRAPHTGVVFLPPA